MKSTKEIFAGEVYLAKVRGHLHAVMVKEIDKSGYERHSTVRIICTDITNGQEVIFRSPARLFELIESRSSPAREG